MEYDITIGFLRMIGRIFGLISRIVFTAYLQVLLRLSGVKHIGKNIKAIGRVHIAVKHKNSIKIGNNVMFVSRVSSNLVGLTNPMIIDTTRGGQISIGDFTGLSGCVLSSASSIEIGTYVNVGGNVRIFDHDFHPTDWRDRFEGINSLVKTKTRPIKIGDHSFIGTQVIILKGSIIGERSIVAAGSVVAGLVAPPDSLIAGNPAKIIRSLI